jgi:hypothetical protein
MRCRYTFMGKKIFISAMILFLGSTVLAYAVDYRYKTYGQADVRYLVSDDTKTAVTVKKWGELYEYSGRGLYWKNKELDKVLDIQPDFEDLALFVGAEDIEFSITEKDVIMKYTFKGCKFEISGFKFDVFKGLPSGSEYKYARHLNIRVDNIEISRDARFSVMTMNNRIWVSDDYFCRINDRVSEKLGLDLGELADTVPRFVLEAPMYYADGIWYNPRVN